MPETQRAQPLVKDILEGVAAETVYRFDDGIFAFEGVSPRISEEQRAVIEARLRGTFDQVLWEWFDNALGLRSVFWRAWMERIRFGSVSCDGKFTTGALLLSQPPWRECQAMDTQRPKGFGRKRHTTQGPKGG